MLNPFYFDRTPLAGSLVVGKAICEDTDAFARFCAREFSLENYIAMLCICAFNRSPSLLRAQTFCEACLNGDSSPLEINIQRALADSVARLVTVVSIYKPNSRDINVAGALPQTALNSLKGPIIANLCDTYERYKPYSKYQDSRIGRLLYIPTEDRKELKKQTTNVQNVIDGLKILERGGWPVRHMRLSNIVIGF